MSKRHYHILIVSLLAVTSANAQFVDLDWNATDTLPPVYADSYNLGRDYQNKRCTFHYDYPEWIRATREEMERYGVDRETLTEDFPVSSVMNINRKEGNLDVTVYPFAIKKGHVVKLLSIKPVFTVTSESRSRSGLLRTTDAADRYAEHSVLSSGIWYKISVTKEGVYQLTAANLSSMGFKDPSKVKIYGYGGKVLQEGELPTLQDDLNEVATYRKSNGNILFYANGTISWRRSSKAGTTPVVFSRRNNTYSKYSCYFVTESTSGSPAVLQDESTPSEDAAITLTAFPEHALVENDNFSVLNSGRRFFEAYDYANGNSRTYQLPLPGAIGDNARLEVAFAASSKSTTTLDVVANDSTLGTITFSRMGQYDNAIINSRTFVWNSPAEASRVKLTHTRSSGDNGHLDYLIASYTRKLEMTESTLPFRGLNAGTTTFTIEKATANTQVWRITHPASYCRVPATLNGTTLTVKAQVVTDDEFIAVNVDDDYPSPTIVGKVANQDLHALSGYDLVIIVPASGKLTDEAQRLADAHEKYDNIKCIVIPSDKIYNEFSSGTPDATAYRRLMKMLYDKASSDADAPKNLLLFGSGFWDNRLITSGLTSLSQNDYLLTYQSDDSKSKTDSYVLEEYFGLLDDKEGVSVLREKPDIGVGRLPVATAAEAKQMVDKLITYMQNNQAGAWKNTIVMMGDDGNDNLHMDDAESVMKEVSGLYPDYHYRKIYWGAYPQESSASGKSFPSITKEIYEQVAKGALIMNYTGHAAAYTLSHERVMNLSDFAALKSNHNPLWFTGACDVSPFDMNEENNGVTSLLNPNGGSISWVTTTRTVYSTQNKNINRMFMRNVLAKEKDGKSRTIGEALRLAKCDVLSSIMYMRDSINKAHFVILGDPALCLRTPTHKVVVDAFNGVSVDQLKNDTIKAGSVVRVTGHITDAGGTMASQFNGKVMPTVYDNLETITCTVYDNETDPDEPFVYTDRTKLIYSGVDTVANGQFTITFPVPLDINYSNESGLLNLYAISADYGTEAQGSFSNFLLGGTSDTISTDTLGPDLKVYLDGEKFVSGQTVSSEPLLTAYLQDKNGINTTGSGIGHNIVAIIDNNESLTFNLNNYYESSVSDYTSGMITYQLPELAEGEHTLLFRAWDTLNNPSSVEVLFRIGASTGSLIQTFTISGAVRQTASFRLTTSHTLLDASVTLNIFDMTGRKVWSKKESGVTGTMSHTINWELASADGGVPPGAYICRVSVKDSDGEADDESIKIVVLGNKK